LNYYIYNVIVISFKEYTSFINVNYVIPQSCLLFL